MLDNTEAILALRARLLTTEVASTGVTTLTCVGNGFTRLTGDFIADGFTVGMEVLPAGFTNNLPAVIRKVETLKITIDKARASEASAGSRSLTVGIPTNRQWIGVQASEDDSPWLMREDYTPGGTQQVGPGPSSWLMHYPIYMVTLMGPTNVGAPALNKVADAAIGSFPPTLAITLADSTVLRVRSNPAPTREPVREGVGGMSYTVVSIPLWGRTQNSI